MRDELSPLAKLIGGVALDAVALAGTELQVGEAVLKALDGKLHGDEYGTVWLGEPGDRANGSTDVGDLDWGPEEAQSEQWVLRVRWT